MNDKKNSNNYIGLGLILGAAVGTVLFSITHQALFIGLGAGLGIVFGSAFRKK